jgi:hypothetical protein
LQSCLKKALLGIFGPRDASPDALVRRYTRPFAVRCARILVTSTALQLRNEFPVFCNCKIWFAFSYLTKQYDCQVMYMYFYVHYAR